MRRGRRWSTDSASRSASCSGCLSGPFFDGIVVATRAGSRFVDAPDVRRIDPDVVELSITSADCETTDRGKYLHVYEARHGRTEITDADRREVVDAAAHRT